MHNNRTIFRQYKPATVGMALMLLFLLTACQSNTDVTPAPAGTSPTAANIQPIDPLPPEQALAPVSLSIPDIDLELPIVPMGWTIANVNGDRTTKWVVPADEVGWHITSPGVGAVGNMLLSGHQAVGEAVLAPLALGDIVEGQEIHVTDEEGLVFAYRVVEVSQPIPLTGASDEDEALAASYAAPTDTAQLTLMTGWPDFTTTHRIFARAEFLGLVN